MHKLHILNLTLVTSIGLAGCAGMSEDGAAAGRLLGGALGVVVADTATEDSPEGVRMLARLAGAAAGAYIGDQFVKALSKRDQQKLYEAQQEAAATGKEVSFSGEEPGVSGRVSVIEEEREPQAKEVEVRYLKERIDHIPPLDLVGAPYRSKDGTVNVRGGPGTDYQQVTRIESRQTVQAIGRVKGKDWLLISQAEDGTAGGFVYGPLMEPTTHRVDYVAQSASAVAEQSVPASGVCKTVRQEVTTAEGSISEDIRVCQQGDGTWKLA